MKAKLVTCLFFLLLLCSGVFAGRMLQKPRSLESGRQVKGVDVRHTDVFKSDPVVTDLFNTKTLDRTKKVVYGGIGVAAAYWIYDKRATLGLLFNKEYLQSTVLSLLEEIKSTGTASAVVIYALAMAVWESVGLSTIPVETAAGMAFGVRTAIFASGLGKVMGASLAFILGRFLLSSWVRERLQDDYTFNLIEQCAAAEPLRVSVFLRYSVFPEFVKNYGASILDPILFWMFVLSTLIHGLPFTCLWSWLGDDTAKRLADSSLPVNTGLRRALVVGATTGLVLSPTLMFFWVRDMQKIQKPR